MLAWEALPQAELQETNQQQASGRIYEPLFVPCTPFGCIYLLEKAGVKIEGANAVVLGRSNIVGMPVALLLIGKNATVTVCHSRTPNLAEVCRQYELEVEEEKLAEIRRAQDRIAFLIMNSDYEAGDIEIEKGKFKELIRDLFPDKVHLYDLIYEPRFRRLWEQFRQ